MNVALFQKVYGTLIVDDDLRVFKLADKYSKLLFLFAKNGNIEAKQNGVILK